MSCWIVVAGRGLHRIEGFGSPFERSDGGRGGGIGEDNGMRGEVEGGGRSSAAVFDSRGAVEGGGWNV